MTYFHTSPLTSKILRQRLPLTESSNPVLLVGYPGTGKTTAVRAYIAERNCTATSRFAPFSTQADAGSCTCLTCTKIWTANPAQKTQDILILNGTDSVDTIRTALAEWTGSLPKELDARYLILRNVHLFTKQTLDTILKLLEEPPPHIHVYLTTVDVEASPPAVQSRAFLLRHEPLTQEQLSTIVRKTPSLSAYTRFLDKSHFSSTRQLIAFGRLDLEKAWRFIFVDPVSAASLEKFAKQLWQDLGADPEFPAPDARAFAVDYFIRHYRLFLRMNDTIEGKNQLMVQFLHQTLFSTYDSFLSNVSNPRASAYINLENQWTGFCLALLTARKVVELAQSGRT